MKHVPPNEATREFSSGLDIANSKATDRRANCGTGQAVKKALRARRADPEWRAELRELRDWLRDL